MILDMLSSPIVPGTGIALALSVVIGCVAGHHTAIDWIILSFVSTLIATYIVQPLPIQENYSDSPDSPNSQDSFESQESTPTRLLLSNQFYMNVAVVFGIGSLLQFVGVVNLCVNHSNVYVVPLIHRVLRYFVDSFTNSSILRFFTGLVHALYFMVAHPVDAFWTQVQSIRNLLLDQPDTT